MATLSERIKQCERNYRTVNIVDKLPSHPTRKWKKKKKLDRIIVHTLASDNQDPYQTNRYHITPGKQNHISKKGIPKIAYHDFICKDGLIYRCNDYMDWTWHCGLWNKKSIGVSLAFRGQDGNPPTAEMYETLIYHLARLCCNLNILPSKVYGHREVPGTYVLLGNGSKRYRKTCPGMGIRMDRLRSEVTMYLQQKLQNATFYLGKVDGDFGSKSKAAIETYYKCYTNLMNYTKKRR